MRFVSFVALLLLALLVPAMAQAEVVGCTDTANVSWEVDFADVLVDAAVVDVPGCSDGEIVGLQLITDDGDVPAEALAEPVVDQRATFDLTPYTLRVEPVTGVRVFLYGGEDEDALEIMVDRRFFNRPGNEQVGLREMTLLHVDVGEDYVVPGAPTRYDNVACSDVGLPPDADVVEEGTGTFTATASGRHIVCYLMQPSPGQGSGPGGQTDVLGDSVTDGGEAGQGGTGAGGLLPSTGLQLLALGAFAIVLTLGGATLARVRRSRRGR